VEEDQKIDDHSTKLYQEDPKVVEGQTFCLELRSSPAPCACSYVIVVPVQYGSHGRQEKCEEPTSSEGTVEDDVFEMTTHDGTVEGMESDGHDEVAGR
jgi:hypothetical protein